MAYPFAAAEVLTAVDLNAMIGAPTQNTQTGTTYTFGLADAGKVNTFDNASPVTATLPAQATVSWPANTVLPVLCLGAGTVTITAAAGVTINGTPLTLETSKGGSLVRTASNVWTFTPTGGGGGKVFQVVSARTTTQVTSTTTTYVDTTLTATITPRFTTSRILIYSINPVVASISSCNVGLRLLRDATVLGTWTHAGALAADTGVTSPIMWEDSPSTVSATTYKIQFARLVGSGTAYVQLSSAPAQIILMEIGA